MNKQTYCGFIAVIGRPNVGKSTLVNGLVGTKISIITKKPQTTRHKIMGMKTVGERQLVFVDTPGLHKNPKHKINKLMIRSALNTIRDVDIIVFVLTNAWKEEDEVILKRLAKAKIPVIFAINKVDLVKDKRELLPYIESIHDKSEHYNISNLGIFPLSAKKLDGVSTLEQELAKHIPTSPHFFPAHQVTDRSEVFFAAEIIREKLMRQLGEEVPHTLTVEIEQYKVVENILRISAIIWVERKGQKIIVIGNKGEGLKLIGQKARTELEKKLGQKIFLQLWVKIKSGWTDDIRALRDFGYE